MTRTVAQVDARLTAEITSRADADKALWVAIDGVRARLAVLEGTAPEPAPVPPPPPTTGGYPPDGPLVYAATPTLPLPGYLSPVVSGGIKITRITNVAGDVHAYSRVPAWNRDGTKILLSFGNVQHHVLDGNTYANIYTGNFSSTPVWSSVDPNKLYLCSGNQFYASTPNGVRTLLHTFATSSAGTAISGIINGSYDAGISDDDQYVAFHANYGNSNQRLITYNIKTDSVIADIAVPAGMEGCQISRKGTYVVVQGSNYTRRYTRDLSAYITLYDQGYHGDNALDASGNEIYVANNCSAGISAPASFLLSTGARTVLFPGQSYTIFQAGHTSGRNFDRPGWVYFSNYDPSFYGTGQNLPGKDQVVAAKTDGSGIVEGFGFAHHSVLAYVNEPHAVPSPDGKRVLFGSEWGGSSSYAYVAEAAP